MDSDQSFSYHSILALSREYDSSSVTDDKDIFIFNKLAAEKPLSKDAAFQVFTIIRNILRNIAMWDSEIKEELHYASP